MESSFKGSFWTPLGVKSMRSLRVCPIAVSLSSSCSLSSLTQMTLAYALFVVGVLGLGLNRRNLILALLSIEIMLLSVSLLVLTVAFGLNDASGQTFAILVVAVAGAESAVGLGILVAYYRIRGTVALTDGR